MSSRYGRKETFFAKLIAAWLATTGIYLLVTGFSFALMLAFFGTSGGDCSLQLLSPTAFFPLKLWQVAAYGMAINYCVTIAIMSFALLLSAVCKTSFVAVIISTVGLIASMLVPSGVTNRIMELLPYRAFSTAQVFSKYVMYSIGSTVISLPCMIVLVSLLISVIMLPLSARCYCKHQVV